LWLWVITVQPINLWSKGTYYLYLLPWRNKKQVTLVTRYHSKQCHFPEHSHLQESLCIHGTRISWLIHKASSSSSSLPSSSAKSEALIYLFHKACHFSSIDTFKPILSKFHFNTVLQLTPASLHSENSEPIFCMNFSFSLHLHMSYISYLI